MDLPAVILQKDGLMCSMITVEYVAELRLNALQNYGCIFCKIPVDETPSEVGSDRS